MKRISFTQFAPLSYDGQEAFNTLCTNLSFSGTQARKLMITSSHAHEGKSFVAMNILRTLAENGKQVVLVDADLRRSCIVSQYGLYCDQSSTLDGLAHLLAGISSLDDVVYSTNIRNAYIVPIGREVSNPLPLLNSETFGQMIEYLSQRFDYVVVDAPPIGVIIDAAQIAKSCSGVLMTVAYNEVHHKELIDAKKQMEQTGCPIIGTVLNSVDAKDYARRKYYYKSYYSHMKGRKK